MSESQFVNGSVVAVPPPSQPAGTPRYWGYGGWLAFFCVIQIFVAPLLTFILGIWSLVHASHVSPRAYYEATCLAGDAVSPSADFSNAIRPVSVVALIFLVTVAVRGLGIYAAVRLRRLQPGAVRLAKVYLLVVLGWAFLSMVVVSVAGYCPGRAGKNEFFAMAVGCGLWLAYFQFSRRVKVTFPTGKTTRPA